MIAQAIEHFTGEYRFLSNFAAAPVVFDGVLFPTVEHAYQAAKTRSFEERRGIAAALSPGQAKRMGRGITLRADWESIRVGVMTDLVRAKFTEHLELREQLVATGDAELIEGNTWNDRFWGVCRGEGQNWLGRILMQVRAELREATLPAVEFDE